MKNIILIALILVCCQLIAEIDSDRYFPKRVIVCFKNSIQFEYEDDKSVYNCDDKKFQSLLEQYKIEEIKRIFPDFKDKKWRSREGYDLRNIYKITLCSDDQKEAFYYDLVMLKITHYIEFEAIAKTNVIPNDPLYQDQWFHENIRSEEAWEYINTENEVLVAICDSGVKWNHPDLQDKIYINQAEIDETVIIDWENGTITGGNGVDDDENGYVDDIIGWCFVDGEYGNDSFQSLADNGHGTHVAGCAIASGNNNLGVVGPAGLSSNIKVLPIRHASCDFAANYVVNGSNGIVFAADSGADIVNCSWGSYGDGYTINVAVQYATDHGTLVIAAAGNDNQEHNSSNCVFPSDIPEVLTVAATNSDDIKTVFSDFGEPIDICAPGFDILSTVIRNNDYEENSYEFYSGTSMSAPIVSGVAAMVKANFPEKTPAEVHNTLTSTADSIDGLNPGYINELGAGRLNAFKALMFGLIPNISIYSYDLKEEFFENGFVDENENLCLNLSLLNESGWMDAENITIELTSENENIELIDNSIFISSLANGETSLDNIDSFIIKFSEISSTFFTFHFHIEANYGSNQSYNKTIDFEIEINPLQYGWPVVDIEPEPVPPLIIDLNNDSFKEIVFFDTEGDLHALDYTGSDFGNFPLEFDNTEVNGVLAAADFQNDGNYEIVAASWNQKILIISHEGDILLEKNVNGLLASNPTIFDIDQDGTLEIAVISLNGTLSIFNFDGTYAEGFPITLPTPSYSPIAVGDINLDGYLDLVISTTNGDMHAISGFDATDLEGFPFDSQSISEKGAIIANIDDNENPEIIFANENSIKIINHLGDEILDYDVSDIKSSVIVDLINNDNTPDICFTSESGELYLINKFGEIQEGFPIITDTELLCTPIVVDFMQNGNKEIIIPDTEGQIKVFSGDGVFIDDLSYSFDVSFECSAIIDDCDNDGFPELIAVANNGIYMINYNIPTENIWNIFRNDNFRSGFHEIEFNVYTNDEINLKKNLELQLYPNPFIFQGKYRTKLNLDFSFADENSNTKLSLYNLKGQKICDILNKKMSSGKHSIIFNSDEILSHKLVTGAYFFKLTNGKSS